MYKYKSPNYGIQLNIYKELTCKGIPNIIWKSVKSKVIIWYYNIFTTHILIQSKRHN